MLGNLVDSPTISLEDIGNQFGGIFFRFGEEKFSKKIAAQIVKARNSEKITTTLQLADIISNAVPAKAKRNGHPARKCICSQRQVQQYLSKECFLLLHAAPGRS